ncbi:MAG: hypothetical protein J0L60_00665 [Ignavibacteria bacterium]|nr:hypothetical protein [Ignavibacteria bacterium]
MRYILLFICILFLLDGAASAQPGPGKGKFRNRGGDPLKKLEQLEKVKLIEVLDLDESTMLKLFSRRGDHKKMMEERNEFADKLLDQMEDLIAANKNGSKDEELKAKISEFNNHIDESHKLQRQFVMSLSDLLSPEKLAKYIVFERNFRREIRDILKKD